MTEGSLEIVRGIYCRTLCLDPDLLAGLAEFATSDTEFDFTDAYPDGPVVRGMDGVRRIAANWPGATKAATLDRGVAWLVRRGACGGVRTRHRYGGRERRSGGEADRPRVHV